MKLLYISPLLTVTQVQCEHLDYQIDVMDNAECNICGLKINRIDGI